MSKIIILLIFSFLINRKINYIFSRREYIIRVIKNYIISLLFFIVIILNQITGSGEKIGVFFVFLDPIFYLLILIISLVGLFFINSKKKYLFFIVTFPIIFFLFLLKVSETSESLIEYNELLYDEQNIPISDYILFYYLTISFQVYRYFKDYCREKNNLNG